MQSADKQTNIQKERGGRNNVQVALSNTDVVRTSQECRIYGIYGVYKDFLKETRVQGIRGIWGIQGLSLIHISEPTRPY